MESNPKTYVLADSVERIDEILATADKSYEEVKEIPGRDRLTFTNGFYVDCGCLFVDIRGSSKLPTKYKRPVLARIYRAYVSEVVAAINDNSNCREINIHGDAVWGVFNTPYKSSVQSVFSTAARISSVIDVLNCRMKKKELDPLTVGIGIADGRARMIKAGFKGSSLNDVVWMGDVVNAASNLCGVASKWPNNRVMISDLVHNCLSDHQKTLVSRNDTHRCWHGNPVRTDIEEWVTKNCK